MAFFTPSALISQIRGSVGDQTFSRNAHGAVVKQKLVQPYSNTAQQQYIREKFAECVSFWQTISEAQRRAWYVAAQDEYYTDSLGIKRKYNGYSFFMRRNMALLKSNFIGIANPPPKQEIPRISSWQLTPNSGDVELSWTTFGSVSGWLAYTRITRLVSPNIKSINPSLMRRTAGAYGFDFSIPIPVFQEYIDTYVVTSPPSGSVVWISIQGVDLSTGLTTIPLYLRVVKP